MFRKLFLSSIVLSVLLCSFMIVSVDAASMWSRTYGGTDSEWACSLVATSDGGYALAAGSEDFWLVKTDETGVVPEFSSWLIPTLVLVTTLPIFINKKKLLHKN